MDVHNSFDELAKKFGMPQRPDQSIITRRCWGCNGPLVSRDINQRYCSKACKMKRAAAIGRTPQPPPDPGRVNYHTYIRSAAWKRKADKAKQRAGYRCQVCNKGRGEVLQLEAHHRTYDNLGNETADDITVLCDECHDLFSKQGKLARKP